MTIMGISTTSLEMLVENSCPLIKCATFVIHCQWL